MRIRLMTILIVALLVVLVMLTYFKGKLDGRDEGIRDVNISRIPKNAAMKAVVLEAIRNKEYENAMLVLETSLDSDITTVRVLHEGVTGERDALETCQAFMDIVYTYREKYPRGSESTEGKGDRAQISK